MAAQHAGLPSISIRMLVAPLPVFFLFPAAQGPELAILAMPFCQIRAVRAVFAGIPPMVIPVRRVVDPQAAGTAGRSGESRRQQQCSDVSAHLVSPCPGHA